MPSLLVRFRRRAISQPAGGQTEQSNSKQSALPEPPNSILRSKSIPTQGLPSIGDHGTPATPVVRHIVPDINALMDTYAAASAADQESPQGLRLPRVRKRSLLENTQDGPSSAHTVTDTPIIHQSDIVQDTPLPLRSRKRSFLEGFSTVLGSIRDSEPFSSESPPLQSSLPEDNLTSEVIPPSSSSSRFSKYGLPRLPQITTSGTWATFGRPKKNSTAPSAFRFSPFSSSQSSRVGSTDSVVYHPRRQSISSTGGTVNRPRQGSVASIDNRYSATPSRLSSVAGVTQSAASTLSRASSAKSPPDEHNDGTHFLQPASPPLTRSSRHNSTAAMSGPPSSPSSPSDFRRAGHDDPANIDAGAPSLESPRTFGYATPPPARQHPSFPGDLPPLPPLDHPDLVTSLSNTRPRSRSRSAARGEQRNQGTSRASRSSHFASRTWSHFTGNSKSRSRKSFTFPRPVRHRVAHSASELTQVVNDENENPLGITPTHRQYRRPVRGYSSLPQMRDIFRQEPFDQRHQPQSATAMGRLTSLNRRPSAEWNAQRATAGVTADNVREFGWPAEVSREILRLSLHEPDDNNATVGDLTDDHHHRGREFDALSPSSSRKVLILADRGRHVPEPHVVQRGPNDQGACLPSPRPSSRPSSSLPSSSPFTSSPSPSSSPTHLEEEGQPRGRGKDHYSSSVQKIIQRLASNPTVRERNDGDDKLPLSLAPALSIAARLQPPPSLQTRRFSSAEHSSRLSVGLGLVSGSEAGRTVATKEKMPVKPSRRDGTAAGKTAAALESRSRAQSNPPSSQQQQRMVATLPRTSNETRVPRRSILNTSSSTSEAGPSTPQRTPAAAAGGGGRAAPHPHFHSQSMRHSSSNTNGDTTTPTHSAMKPRRSSSEPGLMSVLETPTNSKGKRKAEEVDTTPPDQKTGQRATFLIPEQSRRVHHESESSHAPSSYQRKRVRLSTTPSPSPSRPGSAPNNNAPMLAATPNSQRTAPSPLPGHLHRSASRATSTRSGFANSTGQDGTTGSYPPPTSTNPRRSTAERRRSMSEISIPISALIAPHAPSVSRSSTYHMRDPRRPPPIRPTSWSLHFRSEDEEASSLHAWCFFVGFVLFPLWWAASFMPVPKTRIVGGQGAETEKAVMLDDPQVEHDAKSWKFRCRVMSGVSFLTYIPFIVLVAIFVPR